MICHKRVPNVSNSGRVDSHARGSRLGWASMSRLERWIDSLP
jgi:hypothetical protein